MEPWCWQPGSLPVRNANSGNYVRWRGVIGCCCLWGLFKHVVERRSLRRQVRAGVGVGMSAASVSYRGDDEGSGLCQSTVRSDAAGDGSYGSFNFFDRWDGEVG